MLLLVSAAPAQAGTEFEFRTWASNELDSGEDASRKHYRLGWRGDTVSVNYEHDPILVRAGAPAHNGYLHKLDFGLDFTIGKTRLNVTAGPHGTSNIFKHLDFPDGIIVARGAVERTFGNFDLGVRGDYRFGDFRTYPTLSFEFHSLTIDLPWRISWQHRRWEAALEKTGEKWAALDAERIVESSLYLDEWIARLGYRLSPRITLGVGTTINSRISYLDLEEGWIERKLATGAFASVTFTFDQESQAYLNSSPERSISGNSFFSRQ